MTSNPQTSLLHFLVPLLGSSMDECCIQVVASLDRCKRDVQPQLSFQTKSLWGPCAKPRYRYIRYLKISISSSLYTSRHVSLHIWTTSLVFLHLRHIKTRGDLSPLEIKLVN
jgi:hypothetical protein